MERSIVRKLPNGAGQVKQPTPKLVSKEENVEEQQGESKRSLSAWKVVLAFILVLISSGFAFYVVEKGSFAKMPAVFAAIALVVFGINKFFSLISEEKQETPKGSLTDSLAKGIQGIIKSLVPIFVSKSKKRKNNKKSP